YFYVVTAIDANSESADSTEASGTPTYVAPPAPPTVNSVTSPTVVSSQTISGTKEANTSIWMNDVQVVPLDSNTDWSVTVYFTADETSSGTPTDGTYTYSFRARYASTATSAPTEVSIDFSTNTAPVAVITYSPDFPAFGNTVTVYGTGSYDNEADTLSYSWTLNKPAGSSAGLASTNTATTSFTVDKTGDYTVYLTVNDGTVDSPTVNVTITIPNTAPVADFTVNPANPAAGNTITVDGRVSSDNENDTLSYSWTLDRPVGSNAALANATAATTTFTADVVGDYTARLTVFDGTDYSTETAKLISVIEPPDSFSINGTIYTEGSINPDDPWIFSYRDITQPFGILTYVYMLTNDDGLGNYDKYFMLIAAGDTTGTYPIDNYLNATATYQANGTSDLVYYADDLNVPGENLVITSYGDVDQPITGTYMANLCYWEYDKCDGVPYNPENFYGTFTATRDPDLGSSLNPQYEIYTRHGVRSIFGANYYQVDVEPWVDVEVRITNVTDDVGLAVYTDSTYTNAISCTTATTGPGTSDEVCLFPGLGGVLPFAVSYNGIGTEAEYDVNVISKSTLTFGTADLPHNGTAYNVGIQLFQITGLTAGQTYTVNLTNISNDVDLFVYDLPDRTNLLCSSEGFADETCDVIAPGNMLYVAVDNYWGDSGDTYTLDVQQYIPSYPVLNYPAEFPYVKNTTVAYGYSEVFQVNTLGSGYYYISLTNLTEDIDLYVYDDAGLVNLLCSSTTYNNEYCWVLTSGTSFYVMLENWGTLGAPFTLDVELSQYHIEDLPVPHVTEDSGRRVYRVTGLYPGADYVVALTDVSNDVNLSVYEDPGLINLICFPFQGWQMDEICQITATGDSLYIAVDNSYGTAGDSYTLFVQHDFVYLDSFNLPATFSTSVGSGQSEYYYIYGLMSGWNTFELSSISGDVDLYVYDDPALTQLVCQSNNIGPTTEMCQGNLSFMEAYIKVLNKGGIGNSYTLHAYY
ncbi:MAG: PKD domain-containing protein, partial [Deltaproteobacteria bacterium]|nr:PKD domain-containing protein [Deltaproteobacteria bacterium]